MLVCRPGAKVSAIRKEAHDILNAAQVNDMVIHVGGNNIPEQHPRLLSFEIAEMLRGIKQDFPKVRLHFSA